MNNLTIEYRQDDDGLNWYICWPENRNEFDESKAYLRVRTKEEAEIALNGMEDLLRDYTLVIPERVDN